MVFFKFVLRKASDPIDNTPLPIMTEVRPLHQLKALSPMDVTLLGMVTEDRPLQLRKASLPMEVTSYFFPLNSTWLGITSAPEMALFAEVGDAVLFSPVV